MPDHSVVHRYARCLSYPEWGVGSVTGIYFTGGGDDVQQWARVKFAPGVRTVPAGSLQFVDFSKPDPGAERVQRFMTAAQHAMAEGDYPLAAKRLIYARDAEPSNPSVLRLMTLAFWQAGELSAAGRAVRDWARVEGERPAPHRFAARIYEDMGAIDLAAEAADRAAARGPEDADAWERVGRLRLRLMDREAAISALEHARRLGPSVEGLLDLALAHHLAGDLGAEVTATEQATLLDPASRARVGALRARARAHRPHLRRHRGRRARARPQPRRRRGRRPPRAPAPGAARACSPRREGLGLRSRRARPAAARGRGRRRARARRRVRRPALGGPAGAGRDPGAARRAGAVGRRRLDRRPRSGRRDAVQRARGARPRDGRVGDGRDPGRRQGRPRVRRAAGAPALGARQARRRRRTSACSSSASARSAGRSRRCSPRSTARSSASPGARATASTGPTSCPALLPEADVVVNLLPLTDATRGAVGAPELAAMRDGALYVNAGRGATTDTGALVDALGTGRIRAVLDVVDPEPLPADHPLWTAPGVMISPHSAGDTPGADRAAWALAAAQLRRYAAGEQLENVVSDGY